MLKAVFFDFWGTIVVFDNTREVGNMRIERAKKIRNELANSNYNFTSPQVFDALEKTRTELDLLRTTTNKEFTADKVIRLTLLKLNVGTSRQGGTVSLLCKRLAKIYSDSLLSMNIALRTGTVDLLNWLKRKNLKIGIISNTEHGKVEITLLKKFHIAEYFNSITFSSDVGTFKPATLIFQKALSSLELKPDEAILIGDSFNADIIGAKQCGIKTIYLKTELMGGLTDVGQSTHSIKPDAVIENFAQIPAVISWFLNAGAKA